MSLELYGIGTHGKKIALFKQEVNNNIIFIKEAMNDESNHIIEREYQGYQWYFQNIIKKSNPIKIKREKSNYLQIPFFRGQKFNSEKLFHKEMDKMFDIVRFYKKNWPINENFVVHGDMALSNFIINNNNFYLIDWEHFHKSHLNNFGFDILNMLFISFYYRLSPFRYSSFQSKKFMKKCFTVLFNDISSKNNIIDRPFYSSKKYLLNNYTNNCYEGFDVKKKFMLANSSTKMLNKLDLYLTS
jgi:hypothetical protein